ncbi:ABC transporter permease [Clostridium rectalis]|uniref:ABC transporter permease n=1 Tax=Clostridium rectalis TaxID=2040295 RepID=UPI000F639621|nr:ABC transporter permease [Clostridium rectalis]
MGLLISFLQACIVAGTPLLLATLGELICEKAGNLNLGVEGMMLMGAVIGFMIGILTKNPMLAMLGSMISGALGAFIYAVLTIGLRANQVVSGLTLTIFGTGISSFIGKDLVGKVVPSNIKNFFTPIHIPLLQDIPIIGDIFFKQDIFVYIGYILALVIGIYIYKTSKGLNLIAIGENPKSAESAGINVILYKYIHVLLGGALCGLGGAYLSLVYVPTWQDNITAGRGWIAVALVIFASWNPYKALIGSYLFGGLDIIGFRLQGLGINVSQYVIDMLPYVITIIVMVFVSIRKSSENSPPKSLSVPYFREER